MARRDNRLIRLCEEVAGMPVIDLTKANERRIEPHHHTCIHGQDLRRIGTDRFRNYSDARLRLQSRFSIQLREIRQTRIPNLFLR